MGVPWQGGGDGLQDGRHSIVTAHRNGDAVVTDEARPADSLAALLSVSRSIAYARFASDGRPAAANPRFRSLFPDPIDAMTLPTLVVEGQREEMARLLGGGELPGEARSVHLAAGDEVPVTLLVTWARDGDELVLLGEPEVDDLEAAQATLVRLNARVSDLVREGARNTAQLERSLAERTLAEAEIRRLNRELEGLVLERTAQLEATDEELAAFVYSASHDLRAPLRAIDGFSQIVLDDARDRLTAEELEHLQRVRSAAQRMALLIDQLIGLSRATRSELVFEDVDLGALATAILNDLRRAEPERKVETIVAPGLHAKADAIATRAVLVDLLNNAWKFTAEHESARIEVGVREMGGQQAFYVCDDGAGFERSYASQLFGAFQHMHEPGRFDGSGIGLATVKRLITRHGGSVWVEAAVEQGTTVYFTLPSRAHRMPETTLDAFVRDHYDGILAAVQGRLRGDETMSGLATQRELGESDLTGQVLGFWLQAIVGDLTLGSTVTVRHDLQWLVRLRAGHDLRFADAMVRHVFEDISREIDARLESDELRAEYEEYRREVITLIDEAFPA
jgi:signal transduction histidine kinase